MHKSGHSCGRKTAIGMHVCWTTMHFVPQVVSPTLLVVTYSVMLFQLAQFLGQAGDLIAYAGIFGLVLIVLYILIMAPDVDY